MRGEPITNARMITIIFQTNQFNYKYIMYKNDYKYNFIVLYKAGGSFFLFFGRKYLVTFIGQLNQEVYLKFIPSYDIWTKRKITLI